jgi:hypothetical protein
MGHSVLKGVIIYGDNPDVVSSRVCNFRHGVFLLDDFDPKIHSLEKQCVIDGELVCKDIFETVFTIDEEVKVGNTRSIELYRTYLTPEVQYFRSCDMNVNIFVCDRVDPFYTPCHNSYESSIGRTVAKITRRRVELQIAWTEMVGTYIFNDW